MSKKKIMRESSQVGQVSPVLQAKKALRESRGIAVLFFDLGTRRG
jgi:hypothetical protein